MHKFDNNELDNAHIEFFRWTCFQIQFVFFRQICKGFG